MTRYMIYMPAEGPDRLIPCGEGGSLTLSEMETLVEGSIEVFDSCLEPEWAREPVDTIRLVVGEDAWLFDAKQNYRALLQARQQDHSKIVGDAFLCAEVDGELIGFTLPVARTICEEFGIDVDVGEDV